MTPEQLHQIDQARRYAEQDEYVVTRTHIRNLLAIIEQQAASAVIDEMVCRFLSWKLPDDFSPDCGISFDRKCADKWAWPIGTNLFTATQARAMLEHVVVAQSQILSGGWQSIVDRIVPDLCSADLSEETHCCQWTLAKDRTRIRRELLSMAVEPKRSASAANGWKLVPLTADSRMIQAAEWELTLQDSWAAMVKAAPEAPK